MTYHFTMNRNQLVVLIFLAKCVIWNITAQYQYFEFNKMVLKCSYLFIGYDSKWNWYRGYSTTNTKMFVSWFVFLLFLLWISKAFWFFVSSSDYRFISQRKSFSVMLAFKSRIKYLLFFLLTKIIITSYRSLTKMK